MHSDLITNARPYAVSGIDSKTDEKYHNMSKLIGVLSDQVFYIVGMLQKFE